MKYRSGELDDWHALAKIIKARQPDSSCYSGVQMAESEVRAHWAALLADKDTTTLVLEDGGAAVGFLAMTVSSVYFSREKAASDSLYAVRQGYEGHGAALLRTYLSQAKKDGVRRVEMSVANGMRGNERTYQFLAKLGMAEIGRVFHKEL